LAAARVERHRNRARVAETHESAARETVEAIAASMADASLRARFLDRAKARFPDQRRPTSPAAEFGLTRREVEIAALIGQGRSNRAIARSLRISERTVEKHVENVLGKLMLESRTQVALWVANMSLGAERPERSGAKRSPGPPSSVVSKPL
jgi:non-specific serine/threonine protein kinase